MEAPPIIISPDLLPTFQAGGHYYVETNSDADIANLIARLPPFPKTIQVPRDGGLMSHLSVRSNLSLPLEYHEQNVSHFTEDTLLLLELCGEIKSSLPQLLESYPDNLTLYEKRLAGFVRALLLEPEVLVLDDLFDGLSTGETSKAQQWEKVFRLRFPFRILLYCKRQDSTRIIH